MAKMTSKDKDRTKAEATKSDFLSMMHAFANFKKEYKVIGPKMPRPREVFEQEKPENRPSLSQRLKQTGPTPFPSTRIPGRR